MARSTIPQQTLDAIEKTRGTLASVKLFLEGHAARLQAAKEEALNNGASEAELAPIAEVLDDLVAESDNIANMVAANP